MLLRKWLPQVLVSLQFFLAALIVLTINVGAVPIAAGIASGGGILLWAWAIFTMKWSRLSMQPDVSTHAKLLTRGPFRLIRHPMYSGLVLFLLGCVFSPFLLSRVAAWLVLVAVLVCKARIDEQHLLRQFSDYAEYQNRTKRFVPFLF